MVFICISIITQPQDNLDLSTWPLAWQIMAQNGCMIFKAQKGKAKKEKKKTPLQKEKILKPDSKASSYKNKPLPPMLIHCRDPSLSASFSLYSAFYF